MFLQPPEFTRPVRQAFSCPRLCLFLSRLVCFSGSRRLPGLTFSLLLLLLTFQSGGTQAHNSRPGSRQCQPRACHPMASSPLPPANPSLFPLQREPGSLAGASSGERGAESRCSPRRSGSRSARSGPAFSARRPSGASSRSPACGGGQKGKLPSEFGERQKSLHPVPSQTSFTCFPRQFGMAGPAHTYTVLTFPMRLSNTREEGQDHHRSCLKSKAHAENRIFFFFLGIWDHTTHLRICLNRGFVGVPGMGWNFKILLICIFYCTLGGR